MSKIPQGEWSAIAARCQNGESISNIARSYGCTPPAIHYILKRSRQRLAAAGALRSQVPAASDAAASASLSPPAAAGPPSTAANLVRLHPAAPASAPRIAAPGPAPRPVATPGLDADLHHRAEAAIEQFRTSFAAAIDAGSPEMRARLREAASELMRVAARTTIVLDRASADAAERGRTLHYPRPAHARDNAGELGPG